MAGHQRVTVLHEGLAELVEREALGRLAVGALQRHELLEHLRPLGGVVVDRLVLAGRERHHLLRDLADDGRVVLGLVRGLRRARPRGLGRERAALRGLWGVVGRGGERHHVDRRGRSVARERERAHRGLLRDRPEHALEVRGLARAAALHRDLLDAVVDVGRDLSIDREELAGRHRVDVALREPRGLLAERGQRARVLEEREQQPEQRHQRAEPRDDGVVHRLLVEVVRLLDEAERAPEQRRGAAHRVARAELPRLAGDARVHHAQVVPEDPRVGAPLGLVALVGREPGQIARDGVELTRVEALGGGRRHAGVRGVERDRGAGALRQLARVRVVEDAGADDRAGGRLRRIGLDGARHDLVQAAVEHPGVVAHPAVQRVGDQRVPAELEVEVAGDLIEPHLRDDPAVLVDREQRGEPQLGRELLVDAAQQLLGLLLRVRREFVGRGGRLAERGAQLGVEREVDQRRRALARVVLHVPGDDLRVAVEPLAHHALRRPVVHRRADVQREHEERGRDPQHEVPEPGRDHLPFSLVSSAMTSASLRSTLPVAFTTTDSGLPDGSPLKKAFSVYSPSGRLPNVKEPSRPG